MNKILLYLKERKLILAIVILYTIIITLVCLHRFWQYEALYYDHGMMEETAWNLSQFKPPLHHREYGKVIYYVDHFLPSMQLVLAPFYWLWPAYETPIIVMCFYIGLSVLFAYEIACAVIKNKMMIYALLFAYMFYIGMQNAIIFLVHDITAQILFLMLLFFSIFKEKKKLFLPLLILNLGFKESVAITTLTLGIALFLFYKKEWRQYALATIIISASYGFLLLKIIFPYFNYLAFGKSLPCIYSPDLKRPLISFLVNFIDLPEKRETIFVSLASFGFLPLFSPFSFIMLLQDWLQRFVLIHPHISYRHGLNLHYNANLAVLLFCGSLLTLKWLQNKKWYKKIINFHALIIFFLIAFYHRFIFHGPLGLIYNKDFFKITKNMKFMDDFVAKIPKKGKIMVQNNLACRFTHNDLYILLSEEVFENVNPDVIALDFRPGQNPANFWPMHENDMKQLAEKLLQNPNYQTIFKESHRYIFVKKQ